MTFGFSKTQIGINKVIHTRVSYPPSFCWYTSRVSLTFALSAPKSYPTSPPRANWLCLR
jgi:hypothetical protein